MLPLVYHPNYSFPFPAEHRFVMSKFEKLYNYAETQGWVRDDKSNLFQPAPASVESLSIVHDTAYLRGLQTNQIDPMAWRRVGLPWSEGLVARTFTEPAGTLLAAELALEHGIACHLGGGTHHAHADFGSGFCMANDLAYAAKSLLAKDQIERVLIFDCDVHQGDGTAAILQDEPRAFTCSIHCEKNFPFRKSESDLDIGLMPTISEAEYLKCVSETFESLLVRLQPDLVLYDAGVDIWEGDELGRFDISLDGIYRRDLEVLTQCRSQNVSVATVIGGGYDKDPERLAERHGIVIKAANKVVENDSQQC